MSIIYTIEVQTKLGSKRKNIENCISQRLKWKTHYRIFHLYKEHFL